MACSSIRRTSATSGNRARVVREVADVVARVVHPLPVGGEQLHHPRVGTVAQRVVGVEPLVGVRARDAEDTVSPSPATRPGVTRRPTHNGQV